MTGCGPGWPVADHGSGSSVTSVRRLAEVALSAPALAHQWARQESAPHGAAVVAHREIAARGRGGLEWTHGDAVAVSVVARPASLAPSAVDICWLATGLSAADTVGEMIEGRRPQVGWPDQVQVPDGVPGGVDAVSVLAESILGPGQVAYAVLTVRLAAPFLADDGRRESVADAAVSSLQLWADRLDEPWAIAASYQDRCPTIGRAVAVERVTGGSLRGTAAAVTDQGALVVRSPTDLDQLVTVAETRTLTVL